MDELEKWAKDKPQSLVMLAVIWATVADSFHMILKNNNRILYEAGFTDVPPVKMWLKYYQNPRFFEIKWQIVFSY